MIDRDQITFLFKFLWSTFVYRLLLQVIVILGEAHNYFILDQWKWKLTKVQKIFVGLEKF